jgi:hypothetical protein
LLFIVPQQFTLVLQVLQGRQPPKQLNSFDHPGHFIYADQLGFCEKKEIDTTLPLKQTKRNFAHEYAWFPDADTGRMRRFQQMHVTLVGTRS